MKIIEIYPDNHRYDEEIALQKKGKVFLQ